jgi:dCTP deaminase
MIEPFEPQQVKENATGRVISYGTSSYGYDVRCANEFKLFTNLNSTIVDPKNFDADSFVDVESDVCIIPPNSFALARTVEYFRIPRDILAIVSGKSTYARMGIVVNVTPLEPCFAADTEILTRHGWKTFDNIVIGTEVFTMHPETGFAQWQPVERIQAYPYSGKLLHFDGDSIDLLVTPDHMLYVDKRSNSEKNEWKGWHKAKAETVFSCHNYRMNCKVNWQGEDVNDWIDIGKQRYNTNQFLKFMGIYLGDGSSLDACLVAAMKGLVPEKSIPQWVKDLPAYRLEYLLEGLMASDKDLEQNNFPVCQNNFPVCQNNFPVCHFDERRNLKVSKDFSDQRNDSQSVGYLDLEQNNFPVCHFDDRRNLKVSKDFSDQRNDSQSVGYFVPVPKDTFSKRLADDIQEVMFKLGTVAIVNSAFGGNYKVRQSEVLPEIDPKTHKTVDYVGMVYDVTVPNHIIFVRRNGKAVWSGNCWEGHITLEFSNTTPLPAKIYANEGVAQVLFLGADEVCEISYKDRGGKYQGQTGVTLPKA